MAITESVETAGYRATVHTANEIGIHRAVTARKLAEPTLEEVLNTTELKAGDSVYHNVEAISGVTWIDFPPPHKGAHWFEHQLGSTYLALLEHAAEPADFIVAGNLISSLLQSLVEQGRLRNVSVAHQKTMQNFEPDSNIQTTPEYIRRWLPGFIYRDRPHPPISMARTDTIRMLASVMHMSEV